MTDVRLVATNPEDSTLVPVASNARGELLTQAPVIEKVPNDVEIDGNLQVNGSIVDSNGNPIGGGGGITLPPDPYEGAVLGWLNGGLAWLGTPPIEVPEGSFGPIESWDVGGYLTVEGEVPATVVNGVTVYQVDELGEPYTEGWNVSRVWSDNSSVSGGSLVGDLNTADKAFNGSTDTNDGYVYAPSGGRQTVTFSPPITYASKLEIWCWQFSNGVFEVNGVDISTIVNRDAPSWTGGWVNLTNTIGTGSISSISVTKTAAGTSAGFAAIRADDVLLVDQGHSLNLRVSNVVESTLIGVANQDVPFTAGKFVKVPAQKVAPWVAQRKSFLSE